MPTYQIKTDNHSETVAAMTIILAAAVFRAKYRIKEPIKSIKIMELKIDPLRKTLMLYSIERRINMSDLSKGLVANPFPIGRGNAYKFYTGRLKLSKKQTIQLTLFFELENYTK